MSHDSRRREFDRRPRKRRNIDKRCQLKRRFVTEVEARAAGMVTIEERGTVRKLWCYACPHCDGWHLTSKPHPKRFEITAEGVPA